jgi:hypothetical protein
LGQAEVFTAEARRKTIQNSKFKLQTALAQPIVHQPIVRGADRQFFNSDF